MPDIPPIDISAATPPTIDHLCGQASIKQRVKVALEAAWADGTAFQHTLMLGAAGLGKTLCANIIAREMGGEIHEFLAQTFAGPGQLEALLLQANDRDCLFIDEIHQLLPHQQVLLYRAMEEGKLFVSSGGKSPPKVLPLRKLTILAATTDEWSLLEPLRDRFKLLLRFQPYSVAELTQLLHQRTQLLHWRVDETVFEKIARRSKGTPRLGLRLLESCWRTARSRGEQVISQECFDQTCQMEDLDPLGLDNLEQRLLHILAHAGEPVRLNVIASKLHLPARTVAMVVERYLLAEELIIKTGSGFRDLTPKGREHLRITQPPIEKKKVAK